LFKRVGRRIQLADVGVMYLREVTFALDRIRGASLKAMSFEAGAGTLRMAVLPTFGSKWLLPRLHRFYQQHPGVTVHIHTRFDQIEDFDLAGVDAAIGIRDQPPKGLSTGMVAQLLHREDPVPIASPALLEKTRVNAPVDLTRHRLLHVAHRPQAWANWFAAQGLSSRAAHTGPMFELTAHLVQAASAGIGIGLVPQVLVEEELRKGTLVVPIHVSCQDQRYFCLTHPSHNDKLPQLLAFKEWLRREIEPTGYGYRSV
jgi:DNA-binding transcriptional LysR family regulator